MKGRGEREEGRERGKGGGNKGEQGRGERMELENVNRMVKWKRKSIQREGETGEGKREK